MEAKSGTWKTIGSLSSATKTMPEAAAFRTGSPA